MELEDRVALLEDHISELYGLLGMPLRETVVERQFEERMEFFRKLKKKAETPVKEFRPAMDPQLEAWRRRDMFID